MGLTRFPPRSGRRSAGGTSRAGPPRRSVTPSGSRRQINECFCTAPARRCGGRWRTTWSRPVDPDIRRTALVSGARRARDRLPRGRAPRRGAGAVRGASRRLRELPALSRADARHDRAGGTAEPGCALAAGGTGAAGGVPDLEDALANEPAARADDEPQPAELRHVLAQDLTRLPVADVEVEGPSRIRRLHSAVCAASRSEERPSGAVRGGEPAPDDERRPGSGADARAGAPPARVAREGVEHVPPTVEKHLPEPGAV